MGRAVEYQVCTHYRFHLRRVFAILAILAVMAIFSPSILPLYSSWRAPSPLFELLWISYGYSYHLGPATILFTQPVFTNNDASCNGVAPSGEETSAVDELAGGGSSDDPVTRCTDDP